MSNPDTTPDEGGTGPPAGELAALTSQGTTLNLPDLAALSYEDLRSAFFAVGDAAGWWQVRIAGAMEVRQGKRTLDEVAWDLKVPVATLKSWRYVDKKFPASTYGIVPADELGRPNFSVGVAHVFGGPWTLDRADLVKQPGGWTVDKARDLARLRKAACKDESAAGRAVIVHGGKDAELAAIVAARFQQENQPEPELEDDEPEPELEDDEPEPEDDEPEPEPEPQPEPEPEPELEDDEEEEDEEEEEDDEDEEEDDEDEEEDEYDKERAEDPGWFYLKRPWLAAGSLDEDQTNDKAAIARALDEAYRKWAEAGKPGVDEPRRTWQHAEAYVSGLSQPELDTFLQWAAWRHFGAVSMYVAELARKNNSEPEPPEDAHQFGCTCQCGAVHIGPGPQPPAGEPQSPAEATYDGVPEFALQLAHASPGHAAATYDVAGVLVTLAQVEQAVILLDLAKPTASVSAIFARTTNPLKALDLHDKETEAALRTLAGDTGKGLKGKHLLHAALAQVIKRNEEQE